MDLVRLLNEPESALPIDKKQVYRWLEGKMPHKDTLDRIAAALRLESPEDLFRHPDEIWIRQLLKDKSDEERERIKAMVESNQIGKAQALVLDAIEKQVGGAAAATADGTARMKESFAQLIQAFAMPFSQAFQNLPMMMEGGFEEMRKRAETFGGVFRVAIEDSFKGEYDGLVKIGVAIASAIGAGMKAGFKIAVVEAGQMIWQGLENIIPLRRLEMFQGSGKMSEEIGAGKTDYMAKQIENAVFGMRDAMNSLSAPVGVTPTAQRLFDQGVRAGDPGYGGTEMSKMLETLERIARAVDKPFPN
jgi:hypothetical protein